VSDHESPRLPVLSGTQRAHPGLACSDHTAVLLIIPSAVDPPARGAGRGRGAKVERPTGRSWPRGPGLLGLPGSMADWMSSTLRHIRTRRVCVHPGVGEPPPEASLDGATPNLRQVLIY
jgi:hypothetical protein